MVKDKYSAVWVSHSSLTDFLVCPRAYFLKNVYKDPKTGHKIQLMSPPLALGQAVHEVLETLSNLPAQTRFDEPLMVRFEQVWEKVSGKKGGFFTPETEKKYKQRGETMISRIVRNPGPLKKLTVKINQELPYFWLSEEENIILCGKIDWLEYLSETDSIHIIDFKTGSNKEQSDSLQLPIYHLLVSRCQKRLVSKMSYWYLEQSDRLTAKELPNLEESKDKIFQIAKKIKLTRSLNRYLCPRQGCQACDPFEAILRHEAELVGTDRLNRDIYVLDRFKPQPDATEDSTIL
jgi:ATP-dependent helicase/DNAse subunit B